MVTLRLLEPSDAPLLLRWLKDPRVLEYWEGPHEVFTPGRIREEFYEAADPTTRCLVQYGGGGAHGGSPVSFKHLRAPQTKGNLVFRLLLLEKKRNSKL